MGSPIRLVSFSIVPFTVGLGLGINGWDSSISAQIIPDTTLGLESSVVESGIVDGMNVDQIKGGAIRTNILFHSFSEFDIAEGRGAYFTQPGGIESILSRVTGENASNIIGRLGVLGDADLFLLNPNGIVFGPNASLDISGSFMSTTADGFEFADGATFSAVNPDTAPLLTMNMTPGLQWGGRMGADAGEIITQADLTTGQDLTLATGNVQLDGNLTVGGNLHIEGIDGLGSITSVEGAVFQAAGDVAMDSYTGASLQILAGGSVMIPGEIAITSTSNAFNNSRIELSDGTSVNLNGRKTPTVDIRAGTTEFFGTSMSSNTPALADIEIANIRNPTGTIFLTNRFQPNPNLTGDLSLGTVSTVDFSGGGDITIDSQGGITFNRIDASGGDRDAFIDDFTTDDIAISAIGGNGGNIKLLATGDIFMPYPSFIFSAGLQGGQIISTCKKSVDIGPSIVHANF